LGIPKNDAESMWIFTFVTLRFQGVEIPLIKPLGIVEFVPHRGILR
jgi:hypothetical protein